MTKRNKYHPGGGAVRQCTRLTSSLAGAEITEERAREINTLLQPPSTYSESVSLAKGRRGYSRVNANECNSFRDGSFSNSLIKRTVETVAVKSSSSSPAGSKPMPRKQAPSSGRTASPAPSARGQARPQAPIVRAEVLSILRLFQDFERLQEAPREKAESKVTPHTGEKSNSSPAGSQLKPSASSPATAATHTAPASPPARSPSRVRNPIS
jgi:hypothetical protein